MHPASPAPAGPARPARDRTTAAALVGILAVALALRLWNLGHGLPFAYNPDEELHFVPRAVGMSGGSLDPGYFENPSALTYLLYLVFRVRFAAGFPFGDGHDLLARFAADPGAVFLTARVTVALLGTLATGLMFWAGARFYDRATGLVAAALTAVAFLPVFYSKQALNDVPTLVAVTVALVACLRVHEHGRARDFAFAGAAIGVAIAFKYTAGGLLLVLALAAALRVAHDRAQVAAAVRGLALAGAACVACFLVLNPYTLLDAHKALGQIRGQSRQAGGAKLGQEQMSGWAYYVRSLTWGLGWAPALAALAGALVALRRDWRRAALLLAFPLFLFVFLGKEARYFGRWMLPAYPVLCILAGLAVTAAARALARGRTARVAVGAALAVALCAQGALTSVHVDSVLDRTDTRTQARRWLDAHLPRGAGVVVEPFVPARWLELPAPSRGEYRRWPVRRPFQAYEKRLRAGRVERYRQAGYCWVVVGSHQKDRGLQAGLRNARAYYSALDAATAERVAFSPYARGARPVPFSYDKSFTYYPRAFARPGPLIEIHRLRGCTPR